MEGRTFHGQLRLDNRGFFMMTQSAGSQVRVDPPNLLHGVFTGAEEPTPLKRGVVLIDGRAISAEAIDSADDKQLRLRRRGRGRLTIDMDRVAELVFNLPNASVQGHNTDHSPRTGPGVLLRNGDFVEGGFRGLNGGQVRVNSIIFGPMAFNAAREVARVRIASLATPHDAGGEATEYLVRTADGSSFRTATVGIEGEDLIVEDPVLGRFQIPGGELAEIRYTGKRLQPLAALPLQRHVEQVTLLSHPADPTGLSAEATLRGERMESAIRMSSGAEATWQLPGEYVRFLCRAGVPEQVLPTGRVRFIVQVDGREVYKSPYVSSVDDAVDVAVRLEGKPKSITLSVEGGGTFNPAGLWAEPLLLRE